MSESSEQPASQPAPNKNPRPDKQKRKQSRGRKSVELTKQQRITNDFAACGRCSYFWAGYRVIVGSEAAESAVATAADGWMVLQWQHAMRELIQRSFGVRIDADYFHYEGCCQECYRQYLFDGDTEDKDAPDFRVGLAGQPQ